ncbi:MAG: XkdX family protein [Cetobacterium sp.]
MKSTNYEFYKNMFKVGYFNNDFLKEPVIMGLISKDEYEEITGENFQLPQTLI